MTGSILTEENRDKTIEERDRIAKEILELANYIYSDKTAKTIKGYNAGVLKSQLRGMMNYYDVLSSRLILL